jgi:hypothetical protein
MGSTRLALARLAWPEPLLCTNSTDRAHNKDGLHGRSLQARRQEPASLAAHATHPPPVSCPTASPLASRARAATGTTTARIGRKHGSAQSELVCRCAACTPRTLQREPSPPWADPGPACLEGAGKAQNPSAPHAVCRPRPTHPRSSTYGAFMEAYCPSSCQLCGEGTTAATCCCFHRPGAGRQRG